MQVRVQVPKSFLLPPAEGHRGLLALREPSPRLPSSTEVQRALQVLSPGVVKHETEMGEPVK